MKKFPFASTFAALALASLLAPGCGTLADARGNDAGWCASPRGGVSSQALVDNARAAAEAPPHDEIVLDVWRSSPRGTAITQSMLLRAATRDPEFPERAVVAPPAPPPEPMPVVYTDGGLSRYGLGGEPH